MVRGRTGMVLEQVGLGSRVGTFGMVCRKRLSVVLGLGVHMRGARIDACADGHEACAVGVRLLFFPREGLPGLGVEGWLLRGLCRGLCTSGMGSAAGAMVLVLPGLACGAGGWVIGGWW